MRNYKEYFEQTSKTILFEKFAETDVNGDQVPCLRRFLTEDSVTSDRFYKKVIDALGVRSFKEFLDKFTPWVYEQICPGEDDSVEIKYTLEKPEHYDKTGMDPTALNATALYQMVEKLYEQRKSSGQAQLDFDFSDISNLLSPESQTKRIKKIRGDAEAYMQVYYRLENLTPGIPSLEKQEAIEMVNANRFEASNFYTKGSSAMLTLKLADAEVALLEIQNKKDDDDAGDDKTRLGIPFYDKEGNLKYKSVEIKNKKDKLLLENSPSKKLLGLFKKDFEELAPDYMKKSPEITNLVLSNISTELARTEHKEEFWRKRIETGQNDYKKWMENLADTIAPLIEKFLGVKAFFENATLEGKLDSILIVANSTVTELVMEVKENLSDFLQIINRKRKERIWFAIMPAVSLGNEKQKNANSMINTSDDPFDTWELPNTKETAIKGLVNANDAKIMLDICEEAKIMTFYNYKANENTSFGNINKTTFELMRDKISFGDGGLYSVCCLPNFTVIPEEETTVIINKELYDKGCQDKLFSLQIPAIYIEASYIAAGMMVGVQQEDLLQQKGVNVDKTLTNIRVDIESKKFYKKHQSNMCKENMLPVPKDMEEKISETRFGLYFSDSEITGENGKPINKCYIKNARTMYKHKNGIYSEINNVLFEEFILAIILDNQDIVDPDNITDFLSKECPEWSDEAQKAENNKDDNPIINMLLKSSETITSTDNETIEINYVHAKGYIKPKIKSK